jgi:hypothetical protein
MKKETTSKRKGFKRGPLMKKEVISQTENQEPSAHRSQFAKLTFEGEGNAFRFHPKHEALTVNHTKAISQTKNQEQLAHQSQLR